MRIVLVDYYKDNNKLLGEIIDKLFANSDCIELIELGSKEQERSVLFSRIKELEPDLLLTNNLSGFELTTLTDGVAYNLIDCRQLHIVSNINIDNIDILKKILSITMFFVTDNLEIYTFLKSTYPTIPWLESVSTCSFREEIFSLIQTITSY